MEPNSFITGCDVSFELVSGINKMNANDCGCSVTWFDSLREKWHEVPAGNSRFSTLELESMPDEELLHFWFSRREEATTGPYFDVRGWYHQLYSDVLRGKWVLDVGSGLGIDGITFAQQGARITFIDIIESNIAVLKRLCNLMELRNVDFYYLEDISCISVLPHDYDVIWCQGSLINAPFEVIMKEAQELLNHLVIGGRWIELAYPKTRWIREGRIPFHKWGEKTDGGAPWIEWYDIDKIRALLAPAVFDVILNVEFFNGDFIWFDLLRRA